MKYVPIVRPTPDGAKTSVIALGQPIELQTHWSGNRTPCMGARCAHRLSDGSCSLETKILYYMPALRGVWVDTDPPATEMELYHRAFSAWKQSDKKEEMPDLPGRRKRLMPAIDSPVIFECRPKHLPTSFENLCGFAFTSWIEKGRVQCVHSGSPIAQALPRGFDILPHLGRLFGKPDFWKFTTRLSGEIADAGDGENRGVLPFKKCC